MELVIFFAALIVLRQLRRRDRPPTRIDIYHHFEGGPGERLPDPEEDRPAENNNVIPLRRGQR